MTTMKDYVKNIEKKMKAHQENQKQDDIDFSKTFIEYYMKNTKKEMKAHRENQKQDDIDFCKSFIDYICPYCGYDTVMVASHHMEDVNSEVRTFQLMCTKCGKLWILEFNRNGDLKVYEIDPPNVPNPNGII